MIHESPDGGKTIKSREMNLPNQNSSNNCNTSQTSTEWLFQKLWDTPKDKFTWYAILEQAKEIERLQLIDAQSYAISNADMTNNRGYFDCDKWYNETYGSKGSETKTK